MIASPAGNDLLFDESSLEQGKHFNNKIWNALKLIKMWQSRVAVSKTNNNTHAFAINWFDNRLNEIKETVHQLLQQFKLSDALKNIYSLIWDDYCSWYLEWIKPGFEQPIDAAVYEKTIGYFEELMQLLHPFMPFITEEIYHQLKDRNDDITVKQLNQHFTYQSSILQQGELLKKTITALREARAKNQIKPKDAIKLYIQTTNKSNYTSIENILMKQINADAINYVQDTVANTIVIAIENEKFFIEAEKEIDHAALKESLEKDLKYQQGFLASIMKKLNNERFVQNAKPEILAIEQKKKADCEIRIKTIQESLAALQ